MYYYLFINNYDHHVSNIILLEKKYNLIQTKNVIIFLFNSSNFLNLSKVNNIKIVMSIEKLKNYHVVTKDDSFITSFIKDENSLNLIEKSYFSNKYSVKKFRYEYVRLLDFLDYLRKNNFMDVVLVSGVSYLLYGLRINSDIDVILKKPYKIKYNKKKIDKSVVLKGSVYEELFINKNMTFYFKGFRIVTLETDMYLTRYHRATAKNLRFPKAVADIIMIKKLIDPSVSIPINLSSLNNTKKERILKKLKYVYRTNYNPFEDDTLTHHLSVT